MKVPRSRLLARALAKSIDRRRNLELLEAVNRAYAQDPEAAEKRLWQAMRRQQRRRLQGQW